MISKPAIVFALQAEIAHAKTKLQPHGTGNIHTAIGWMEQRVKTLTQELVAQGVKVDDK